MTAFMNRGFETAGTSPGLASGWTATFIGLAQAFYDYAGGFGNPTPVESFDIAVLPYSVVPSTDVFTSTDVHTLGWTADLATSEFTTTDEHRLDGLFVIFPAPPTGLSAGSLYYVQATGDRTFQVAATSNGTPIAITGGPLTGIVQWVQHRLNTGTPVQLPTPPAGASASTVYFVGNTTQATWQLYATPPPWASSAAVLDITGGPTTGSMAYPNVFMQSLGPNDKNVVSFGTGLQKKPVEDFETQWIPGSGSYSFRPTSTTAIGAAPGFDLPLAPAKFTFAPGDLTAVTLTDGTSIETFGDYFVANVVGATDTFTAVSGLAPENSTPVRFDGAAPSGTTIGVTYYVKQASGATFKISNFPNALAIDILADATGLVLTELPRMALDTGLVSTVTVGSAGTAATVEGFEDVRGVFAIVVDPATDIITAAGHTFVNNDPIQFAGPGLPPSSPSLAPGVTYRTRDVVTGVSFRVAATSGGAAIDITDVAGSAATVFGDPATFWNDVVA